MPVVHPIAELSPTRKLENTLYHACGNALFYAGESLNEDDIETLKKAGVKRVYELSEGESVAGFRDTRLYRVLAVNELKLGAVLNRESLTESDELFSPANTKVTPEMLKDLNSRGIKALRFKREPKELRIEQYRSLQEYLNSKRAKWRFQRMLRDAAPDHVFTLPFGRTGDGMSDSTFNAVIDGLTERIPPFVEEKPLFREFAGDIEPGTLRDEPVKQGFLNLRQSCLERIGQMYETARGDEDLDLDTAVAIARDLARAWCCDSALFSLFPLIPTQPSDKTDNTPAPDESGIAAHEHILKIAVWATLLAANRDFSGPQVIETVTAALVHDLGMLKVDKKILEKKDELSKADIANIQRHPVFTLEMLRKADNLPAIVPFLIFQVHEREDGSGYPLRLDGSRIHIMSKVIAVADAYSELTSGRTLVGAGVSPAPTTPHAAMRELIDAGKNKKLDEELVQLFAITAGLFPIGSWVSLSAGDTARVLGNTSDDLMRPVVSVLLDADNNPVERKPLDLSTDPGIEISKAVTVDAFTGEPFAGF